MRSSNVSVTQVPAEIWFEHFSKLTDEVSIDEVIAATRHCKYGKAAGPDGIATDVIKDCSTVLVWPLYYIFNFCFSNGVCPSVWLSSYLLPLYKGKGPLSEPDSTEELLCNVLY